MTSEPVTSPSAATALLSLCGLFADADPEALGELASELQLVSLKRGELLIRQGDLADCMYSIVSGRLEVTALADDGRERSWASSAAAKPSARLDSLTISRA